MSTDKDFLMAQEKDFFGQDVAIAIKVACKFFKTSQEKLDIEVLETGSAGIFGLCRKKAHIRVKPKPGTSPIEKADQKPAPQQTSAPQRSEKKRTKPCCAPEKAVQKKESYQNKKVQTGTQPPAVDDTLLNEIREDLIQLLELMECTSEVDVRWQDETIGCHIADGAHATTIIGHEGRTLDSLQYLLRKMMSRRLPEKTLLSLDVGNYREQRAGELRKQALELAAEVKEKGKTMAIASLNPSERRVVHMALQDDKAIRSRSVGEGLFKKVLIYRPGKSKKTTRGRKRRNSQRASTSRDN